MPLNEQYDTIHCPKTHYVYVEKIGPFQETAPKAWQEVHQFKPTLAQNNTIIGCLSMYKVEPLVYRAGFSLAGQPMNLPEGLKYILFQGGEYVRFILTGSYSQLPQACGRVFELVSSQGIKTTDNFCLENYVTDPAVTAENKLLTEILIPTG